MSSRRFLSIFANVLKTQKRFLTIQVAEEDCLAAKASLINGISMVRNTLILDNDGKKLRYPFVWLRDNCQCHECFNETARSRIINMETFNVNPKLKKVEHDKESGKLTITWNDNHVSEFDEQWLIDRNFTQENRNKYLNSVYRPPKHYWTKDEFRDILKTFQFQEVMENDLALHDWLDALARYGIAIIKNAPLTKDQTRKLASRVAFIKQTHYGEQYEVKSTVKPNNIAYLNTNLQLHTDLPYYEYKPGVNLLHCLIQSKRKGGENLVSDGFHVASILKAQYPEYFKVLSQTLVNWNDLGKDNNSIFHSILRSPVICEDREGTLVRINHSVTQRDSYFSVAFEVVQYWYEAMAKFGEILREEAVTFKTTEGDILTFDNLRLVHGRTAYDETQDNTRLLIGAYMDWDEIFSRLRILKFNLAEK